MKEELTDKEFWLRYWEGKKNLIQPVPKDNSFSPIFDNIFQKHSPQSAIELGGFPGHFCIYLKKRFNIDVTLFDFVIHPKILGNLLTVNNLRDTDIVPLEGDIMNYTPPLQYDMVFSLGLIEHFRDTQKIIEKHLNFLKPGGIIFISIPNFRGLNGWIQKTFDYVNYDKHNIQSMDIMHLKSICQDLQLEEVEVKYFKSFSVWLENPETKRPYVKMLVKAIRLLGLGVFKIIPITTRFFSPYIIITAKKTKK